MLRPIFELFSLPFVLITPVAIAPIVVMGAIAAAKAGINYLKSRGENEASSEQIQMLNDFIEKKDKTNADILEMEGVRDSLLNPTTTTSQYGTQEGGGSERSRSVLRKDIGAGDEAMNAKLRALIEGELEAGGLTDAERAGRLRRVSDAGRAADEAASSRIADRGLVGGQAGALRTLAAQGQSRNVLDELAAADEADRKIAAEQKARAEGFITNRMGSTTDTNSAFTNFMNSQGGSTTTRPANIAGLQALLNPTDPRISKKTGVSPGLNTAGDIVGTLGQWYANTNHAKGL